VLSLILYYNIDIGTRSMQEITVYDPGLDGWKDIPATKIQLPRKAKAADRQFTRLYWQHFVALSRCRTSRAVLLYQLVLRATQLQAFGCSRKGEKPSGKINVPREALRAVGLNTPYARSRAIKELVELDLIRVFHRPGYAPLFELAPLPDTAPEADEEADGV